MLLDLLGPRSGCWPHDGEVAGGAVADSTLVIFRFGATMELGRSERTTMRPLWSYGVDGANTIDSRARGAPTQQRWSAERPAIRPTRWRRLLAAVATS
jgi:hypothetical protein